MKKPKKPKKPKKIKKKVAIEYIPYEELFTHEYQPTYISPHGDIVVGPYTYNVFKEYTVAERQKIFQDCAKWLNWQVSEIQEEWELCMYMYQWIIKGPSSFPYLEYTLSEDIKMATLLELHEIAQTSGKLFARFEAGMLYNSWAIIEEDSGTANHVNRMVLAKNILLSPSPTAKKYFRYFLSDPDIQTNMFESTDAQIVSAITGFFNVMANVEVS